jgi:hypothetical protein
MRIKITAVLWFVTLCLGTGVYAQDSTNLVFKVVKPQLVVKVSPAYNCLYQNLPHPISITIEDTTNTYVTRLAGGRVNVTDTGTFLIAETKAVAILCVYKVENGVEAMVKSKKYLVLPELLPEIRNKPTDNFLAHVLLLSSPLKAASSYKRKKVVVKVSSFVVDYRGEGGKFNKAIVTGDMLPIKVRKDMAKGPDGSLVYYSDIMVELIPGFVTQIQSYRITMQKLNPADVMQYGGEN